MTKPSLKLSNLVKKWESQLVILIDGNKCVTTFWTALWSFVFTILSSKISVGYFIVLFL